jgi:hypothetical protein
VIVEYLSIWAIRIRFQRSLGFAVSLFGMVSLILILGCGPRQMDNQQAIGWLPLVSSDEREDLHCFTKYTTNTGKLYLWSNASRYLRSSQIDISLLTTSEIQVTEPIRISAHCPTISNRVNNCNWVLDPQLASAREYRSDTRHYSLLFRLKGCFDSGNPFTADLQLGNHTIVVIIHYPGQEAITSNLSVAVVVY